MTSTKSGSGSRGVDRLTLTVTGLVAAAALLIGLVTLGPVGAQESNDNGTSGEQSNDSTTKIDGARDCLAEQGIELPEAPLDRESVLDALSDVTVGELRDAAEACDLGGFHVEFGFGPRHGMGFIHGPISADLEQCLSDAGVELPADRSELTDEQRQALESCADDLRAEADAQREQRQADLEELRSCLESEGIDLPDDGPLRSRSLDEEQRADLQAALEACGVDSGSFRFGGGFGFHGEDGSRRGFRYFGWSGSGDAEASGTSA